VSEKDLLLVGVASARILMRVATKYPEQVLECAEDAAHYNREAAQNT